MYSRLIMEGDKVSQAALPALSILFEAFSMHISDIPILNYKIWCEKDCLSQFRLLFGCRDLRGEVGMKVSMRWGRL